MLLLGRVRARFEALRGVASSGDAPFPAATPLFPALAASVRGDAPLLTSDSRKFCARRAPDRAQAFAPVRQRECELMRQWCRDPADAVRQLAEIASRERPILQEIEQKRVHVRAYRLHGVECEGIAIALIGVQIRRAWDRSRVRVVRGALLTPGTQKDSSEAR